MSDSINAIDTLNQLHNAAWQRAQSAAGDTDDPIRYPAFCTVDAGNQAQARHLVLREVDQGRRQLTFHTERASRKWVELAGNNQVTVLAYCPRLRLQLRWIGMAQTHEPQTPVNDVAWQSLSASGRAAYDGANAFGVIVFQASLLDWFEHPGDRRRRALFRYTSDGALSASDWIAP